MVSPELWLLRYLKEKNQVPKRRIKYGVPNGTSLRSFFATNYLKILAKNAMFVNAKYKKFHSNVARVLSAVPGSKAPLSTAKIC
jgi:hypothetical protein